MENRKAFGQVDPARLHGETLRQWYLRSPQEIEMERQRAEEQKHQAFFGQLRTPSPADLTPLGAPPATEGFRREARIYPGEPRRLSQPQTTQLASNDWACASCQRPAPTAPSLSVAQPSRNARGAAVTAL